jgi:SAM-dependent methyltransferase
MAEHLSLNPQGRTRPYFASYYRWLVANHLLQLDLRGDRILDVGCDDASFLYQSEAPLRVGVDLAPRARPVGGPEIIQADARQLPVGGEQFSCILAFDVLEHIEHDRRVMHELLRVLAPNGTLWFSTPARNAVLWPAFVQPYANHVFGHVRNGYTAHQLRALLPDDSWQMDIFFWDEPFLRAAFVPLHVLDRLAPSLADIGTRLCFSADKGRAQGDRGHIFGRVTRRKQGSS